jgi:hypothetical protein
MLIAREDMSGATKQPSFQRLVLILCLVWLVLNWSLLLGKSVMPWDAMDEFYPTVYFNVHSLRLGLAPWWNPHVYSGYPQIADPQGMLFSPLLMAWMLLREAPGPVWFSWGVLLHLLMGGIAMLAFLQRCKVNAIGALVGATVHMAGGVAASRLEHTPIVIAYGYAPVVLFFLRRFLDHPGLKRGVVLGLVAGAMTVQLVQVSYLFALILVAYGLVGTAWRWKSYGKPDRWQWVGGMAAALVCALAFALPQLLFSWAFMSMSNRATMLLSDAAGSSLDARSLLSLFAPNALHALRGNYDGPASLVEAYLYIGIIPLLAMFALPRAWRDHQYRPSLVFFGVTALFACLYMFGIHTPFYRWLYSWLPGMQHFRRPSDAAYVLNFSLAVMAGIAASRVNLQSRKELTILLSIAVCWLVGASLNMRVENMRWQAFTLTASVCAALALWRLQKPGTEWRATLWLLVILVVDYRCFNLNGHFNQMRNTAQAFQADPAVKILSDKVQEGHPILAPRIETQNATVPWDNMVVFPNILSTQGYNPLRYALYKHWYSARENSLTPERPTPFNPAPGGPVSKLLSAQFLVIGHRQGSVTPEPPADYQRLFSDQHIELWRTDHVYPRLLNPTHAHLFASGDHPDAATFATTDFRDTVLLTPRDHDDESMAGNLVPVCTGRIQATAESATPTRQYFQVHAERAGWLVVSELDFPGWQAELDGKTRTIHRANGLFRAICIPAGTHELRFVFRPWAMVTYAWQHSRI